MSVMLYPSIFCGSVCLVCCVFDSVCELFWLLNVIDVFSVGGGALFDRPCILFQRMCMLYL